MQLDCWHVVPRGDPVNLSCLVWMPSIGPCSQRSFPRDHLGSQITFSEYYPVFTENSQFLHCVWHNVCFLDLCPGIKWAEMPKSKIKYPWEEELPHLAQASSKYFSFSRCLHGKCMVANVAYTCKCMEGYTGMYCDKKNNSSNPCRILKCNHGQCKISEHGEPYCECDPNYSGEHCDRGMLGHRDQEVGLLYFWFTFLFSPLSPVKIPSFLPLMWLGRFLGGIPQITLHFPSRAGAHIFCPDLKRLTGTQWVLASSLLPSYLPVQKEGADLHDCYLGCAFSVNEPQAFQIIMHSLTQMSLAVTKYLHNGTHIFRYSRLLMSCRAGWPLTLRSRCKTNSYFAGMLQDSTLSIH